MNSFSLDILEAGGTFYHGDCLSIIVPTVSGQCGIQAHHSNEISAIVPGKVSFKLPDGTWHYAAVSDGLMKVEDNSVLLLVDSAEKPEDIDLNRARRAEERAREELLQKKSIKEYRMAQMQLARALNRLRIGSSREG